MTRKIHQLHTTSLKRLSPLRIVSLILFLHCGFSACSSSEDTSAQISSLCDSLEAIIYVVDSEIYKREISAYRGGRLDSLTSLRTTWHQMISSKPWKDSLGRAILAPLDTNVLRRAERLELRLAIDVAEREPEQARYVDSLFSDWTLMKSKGNRYKLASHSTDSLNQSRRKERRNLYRTNHPSGKRYSEWLTRLARLRNQHAKELGYSSALDLALRADGLTRDELRAYLTALDSVGVNSYQVALDSIRSYYGETQNWSVEPGDAERYLLLGPLRIDSRSSVLRKRDVLNWAVSALRALGFDVAGLPIDIDTTFALSSDAKPISLTARSNNLAIVLVGRPSAQCNIRFVRDLCSELTKAVAHVATPQNTSPIWVESLATLILQLMLTGEGYTELLNIPTQFSGTVHRWLENAHIMEMRNQLARVEFELELFANPNRDIQTIFRGIYNAWMQMEPQKDIFLYADDVSRIREGPGEYRRMIALLVAAQLYTHGFRTLGPFAELSDWQKYLNDISAIVTEGKEWE
ncbi:hypothetical protein JYT16_02005, partial [Gemmatimonas aurantiaca]|nr:hypothetical protein [Gemmatimonas aurantiaca]